MHSVGSCLLPERQLIDPRQPPRAPAVTRSAPGGPSNPRAITDRTCQPSAHNCRMSTITQTTVVFSCPKRGLNYQATQEHSSDQSSGQLRLQKLQNQCAQIVRCL